MPAINFELKKNLTSSLINFTYSLFMKKVVPIVVILPVSLIHKKGYFDKPQVPICLGLKCNCFNDSFNFAFFDITSIRFKVQKRMVEPLLTGIFYDLKTKGSYI